MTIESISSVSSACTIACILCGMFMVIRDAKRPPMRQYSNSVSGWQLITAGWIFEGSFLLASIIWHFAGLC